MFGSWVLNEIWIIDLSSALVGMLLSSSKLFPLLKEVIVIGTALCYSHQVCCLLYYLDKINSGIHMYQFTFKSLHLADRRIWSKKGTDRRICGISVTKLLTLIIYRSRIINSGFHFITFRPKKVARVVLVNRIA